MFTQIVPGLIVGFREGMEAFLIIGIMLQYLSKINRPELKKNVSSGLLAGIGGSAVFGLILWGISTLMGKEGGAVSKLWESGASLVALIFIATFIYWMIEHGRTITGDVETEVSRNMSSRGLFVLAMVMVLREGAEIVLFTFTAADKQAYLLGTLSGLLIAAVLAVLINRSLVKVRLSVFFNITLAYLILQAGYMLGYSVHEFLSALKTLGYLGGDSLVLTKMFDFSETVFNHKSGALGVPLNFLFGWYSKPEVIQFIAQYGFTTAALITWTRITDGQTRNSSKSAATLS
ncbi:MAG: FTR1 family protein [Spirochaetales bacterium]|nr:FTR1 family protein [Spirochaetales bacterium]